MLAHADVALYQAKAEQRGTYRFFSAGMDAEVRARVSLSTELREALATQQFFLMYQPQVDMSTGRVLGMEALVRWRHPTETLGGRIVQGFYSAKPLSVGEATQVLRAGRITPVYADVAEFVAS